MDNKYTEDIWAMSASPCSVIPYRSYSDDYEDYIKIKKDNNESNSIIIPQSTIDHKLTILDNIYGGFLRLIGLKKDGEI